MAYIKEVELLHVQMKLKKKISHASHERQSSDSVVVVARLDNGQVGYGEGVPREYVTGETVESALRCLKAWNLREIAGEPDSFAELVGKLDGWMPGDGHGDERGIKANAARCAAELAVLDAFARSFQVSLGEAIALSPVSNKVPIGAPEQVRYSGAITAETALKERISATKMRLWGFRKVKVKVGVEGQDDVARLRRIRRRLGQKCDIRLDANEAWTPAEFCSWAGRLSFAKPSAFEQPVKHELIGLLGQKKYHTPFPVILDESLCGMADAEAAIAGGFGEIFNIRLSKCGGILPSLRLVARAIETGRGYGLGCHPGESPILSAAGRAFASRVRNLVFVEGSYDRHVLAELIGKPDITFGYGGKAGPLTGPGLGITIDESKLNSMTIRREVIRYE